MAAERPRPARSPRQPSRPAVARGPAKAGGERETSIRRGVEVLLSLAGDETLASGGLGVTRIAELLGREKSQVSRSLKALSEYGLVERNPDSTYRLGWRLYALAQLAGERRLLELAAPMMRRHRGARSASACTSRSPQGIDSLTVLSESPGRGVETVGWAGRVTPGVLHLGRARAAARHGRRATSSGCSRRSSSSSHGPRTVRDAGGADRSAWTRPARRATSSSTRSSRPT